MKVFINQAGKVCRQKVTEEDRKRARRYWIGVHAVCIAFLCVCCAAAGVI